MSQVLINADGNEVKVTTKVGINDVAVNVKDATLTNDVLNITKVDTSGDISIDLKKKQNKLVAGSNIVLTDDVTTGATTIAAKDTTYVAGTHITIDSNNKISASEPDNYIKSASVSSNTLTLTKKDDSTIAYIPAKATTTADGLMASDDKVKLNTFKKILTTLAKKTNGKTYLLVATKDASGNIEFDWVEYSLN